MLGIALYVNVILFYYSLAFEYICSFCSPLLLALLVYFFVFKGLDGPWLIISFFSLIPFSRKGCILSGSFRCIFRTSEC